MKRLQYRLRTLLILTTLVAMLLPFARPFNQMVSEWLTDPQPPVALKGGTELKAGLGWEATMTPAAVEVVAKASAEKYAAKNPNAERLVNASSSRHAGYGTANLLLHYDHDPPVDAH